MNYLVIGILALFAIPVVISTFGGLAKGAKRSLLSLILVVASLVVCFIFKDKLVAIILEIKIDDKLIVDFIKEQLPENFQSMTDLIVPLLTALISVLTFFISFIALLVVSKIVYLFLKIFVKKGKKKHALFGMIFGIVQGAVVGIALAAPIAGLLTDLAPVAELDYKVGEGEDAKAIKDYIPEAIDLKGFAADEKIVKGLEIANKVEKYSYTALSTVYLEVATDKVTDDGSYFKKVDSEYVQLGEDEKPTEQTVTLYKKYTLKGQVEAISAAVQLASELTAMSDKLSSLTDGFSVENADDIQDVFNTLDALFGDDGSLSPEAKETVENMISEIASSFAEDLPIDISTIDLGDVDFAKEGETITNLMKYTGTDAQEIKEEDMDEIVKDLAESELILDVLDSSDITLDLGDNKDEAEAAVAKYAETDAGKADPEAVQNLKYLLGLETKPAEESTQEETPKSE